MKPQALKAAALVCGILLPGPRLLVAEAAASGSIEISAPAPEKTPAPTAGRSAMDAQAIEASGATTVAEVLSLVPGVSLSSAGSAGSQMAVSVRGSTTNQVLVLVDGIPVSDPSTGLTDLSRLGLAPEDIDSIEVVKGGASAQYGPDAVGGVVIITTKRSSAKKPAVAFSFSNLARVPFSSVSGSGFSATEVSPSLLSLVDGQSAALSASLPWGLRLSLGGERAENAYQYHDSGEVSRARANADLLAARLSLGWQGYLGGGSATASLGASMRSLGVPGSLTSPSPEAREEDYRLQGGLGWSTDAFFSDQVAFQSSLYGLASSIDYQEDSSALGDTNLSSRAGGDARWSILFSRALSLGLGLSGRYERLDSSNVSTASGGAPERVTLGAYLEPSLTLGPWTLVPAARYDYTSDFASGFSASLGLARSLSKELTFSANASTAYRAPSFDDLWWPLESGTEGNSSLSPETSFSGDLGLRHSSEGFGLGASVFLRYVEDVILWQEGSDGVWRPSNYGDALYPGLELEATLAPPGPFSAKLSWTYLHSYVMSGSLELSDDLRVPMVPEHSFDLALLYAQGKVSGGLDFAYTGLRYYKTANVAYSPAHLVVGAHLNLPLAPSATLVLTGENLLDERYESIQGYPMPGFSLRLGVNIGTR